MEGLGVSPAAAIENLPALEGLGVPSTRDGLGVPSAKEGLGVMEPATEDLGLEEIGTLEAFFFGFVRTLSTLAMAEVAVTVSASSVLCRREGGGGREGGRENNNGALDSAGEGRIE